MSIGKINKKKTIIIDRSKWRTGGNGSDENQTGEGDTFLLNEYGYKCCLGFISGQACKKAIKGYSMPHELNYLVPELSYRDENLHIFNGVANTKLTQDAQKINDDEYTTPQQKEKLLKQLFKNSRYKLVFKGKFTYTNKKEDK